MIPIHIIWDLEDEPGGNAHHIKVKHHLTTEEVDQVLLDPRSETTRSHTSGNPITFGRTATGRHIAVVYEHDPKDPSWIYPITAYDVPEKKRKR